jgi:hypothetical protein
VIATALEVTDDHALVELRPCWLARIFGAKTVRIDLTRRVDRENKVKWFAVNTGTELGWIPYSSEIRHALDFRQVVAPPVAVARERLTP